MEKTVSSFFLPTLIMSTPVPAMSLPWICPPVSHSCHGLYPRISDNNTSEVVRFGNHQLYSKYDNYICLWNHSKTSTAGKQGSAIFFRIQKKMPKLHPVRRLTSGWSVRFWPELISVLGEGSQCNMSLPICLTFFCCFLRESKSPEPNKIPGATNTLILGSFLFSGGTEMEESYVYSFFQ